MHPGFAQAASGLLGPRLSLLSTDRLAYGRDLWPLPTLELSHGHLPPTPAAVAWPETEAEVVALVHLARRFKVPLIPFGGGSNVVGGTAPVAGCVMVDLKRMDQILSLDEVSGVVEVGPGILGQHLEDALNRRGLTLGHFPSSLMLATVGGYVATRSAGQLSSRYGKIEDMVVSLRMVAGTGEVLDTAGHLAGVDWNQLLMGSEGTLGLFTLARLRVRPLAAEVAYRAFRFRDIDSGLQVMRQAMQAGLRPSVLRLYDEIDTLMALRKEDPPADAPPAPPPATRDGVTWPGTVAHPPEHRLGEVPRSSSVLPGVMKKLSGASARAVLGRAEWLERLAASALPEETLLITGVEGEPEEVQTSARVMAQIAARCGGEDLGRAPAERWLAHRYSVSYKLTRVFQLGAFADTIEVAATWDRLPRLYHAVREAVSPHAAIMAHFSHAYHEGCSIYFSLAGRSAGEEEARRLYHLVWSRALDTTLTLGGTVSHHHGVGKQKAPWASREKGAWVAAWRRLKAELDPSGILNPGRLFDVPGAVVRGGEGGGWIST